MIPGDQRTPRSLYREAGSEDEARQRDGGTRTEGTAPARALGSGAAQDRAMSAEMTWAVADGHLTK